MSKLNLNPMTPKEQEEWDKIDGDMKAEYWGFIIMVKEKNCELKAKVSEHTWFDCYTLWLDLAADEADVLNNMKDKFIFCDCQEEVKNILLSLRK